MTPAARIQATIDVLDRVLQSRIPMDSTAGDFFRFRKYIGSKDRANIAARLYAVMRHYAKLTYWLNFVHLPPSARLMVLAYLRLAENFSVHDISQLCNGDKYAPALLDEGEEKFLANPPETFPAAVLHECPDYAAQELQALYGENFPDELDAMLIEATLDLRINHMRADPDTVQNFLAADDVHTHKPPFAPDALRVEGKVHLSKARAFTKGWVEIQDEGSQLIALACDARPGMQVLDYCAGSGGKTLALASAMRNKGRIVAMDTELSRLEKAKPRFRRAGVADIIEVRPLEDEKQRKWLKRQKQTFDVVLADVPCSGSGTWRRNPDLRWRNYGPDLTSLLQTQSEILERVAHTVKVGGRLVYATCSLFQSENEKQIEQFLLAHKDFTILPLNKNWPEHLKNPCHGPFMRLTPLQHQTDGFFAAVLIRNTA